ACLQEWQPVWDLLLGRRDRVPRLRSGPVVETGRRQRSLRGSNRSPRQKKLFASFYRPAGAAAGAAAGVGLAGPLPGPFPSTRPSASVTWIRSPPGSPFRSGLSTTVTLSP